MKTYRLNCQWWSYPFYRHLLFFNWRSYDECSASLERVSYRHWRECNGVCRSL